VDYYEGFDMSLDYNTGLTFNPEVSYNFSRLFSTSLSMYFTTAHSGNDQANLNRVHSVEPFEGVSIASHYQTTMAPAIQFIPLHTKKHQVFIGAGPTYTFGNSLLSETVSETSTTLFKHIDDFGYLGSVGYNFSFTENWRIGGRYVYNKGKEKTEHILLSLGYTID
jgi:outer membrane protein W